MAYKRTNAEGENVMAGDLPKVKTIIVGVARNGGGVTEGALLINEYDAFVSSWIDKGYKLFASHYLGETPNFWQMMFIFELP